MFDRSEFERRHREGGAGGVGRSRRVRDGWGVEPWEEEGR